MSKHDPTNEERTHSQSNETKQNDQLEQNNQKTDDSLLPMTRRSVLRGTGALGVGGLFLATGVEDAQAHETSDHLAETPPMGWNSWNYFACDINAELIKEMADAMVESGMKEAGYEYINIDDCWMAPTRDENGNLEPDPERFPNGIDAVADYVHEKGLKLGIYSSAGTGTCQGLPASLGHEKTDAESFAEWGVDYLKYDNCNNKGLPGKPRYRKMSKALDATDREIVYSLCCWGQYDVATWGADIGGNLWRTTGDITDNWSRIMDILDQQVGLAQYAEPGHWNDPDMLEVGNPGLSTRESRAHFSLWCILSAPLLAGNDLRDMSEETLDILTDTEVLEVNQDWAGSQGTKRKDTGNHEVWAKPMSNGDSAVCLLNRGETTATISIDVDELDLKDSSAYILRDLWEKEETATAEKVVSAVPPHGAVLYRVRPGTPNEAPPTTALSFDTEETFITGGETTTATAMFTNHGSTAVRDVDLSIESPDGWDVTSKSSSGHNATPPSKSVETTWEITAPSGVKTDQYALPLSVSFVWKGNQTASTQTVATITVPPQPPTSDTYLSDHSWVKATIGWGEIGLDESVANNPITIGGTTYERGLGTHAKSKISYYLGGNMSQFVADVGVDDEVGDQGSVQFRVLGDGETLTETDVLTGSMDSTHLDVDISGVDLLTLVVTTGGDANYYDHADWAATQVLK
jgi:alpha-galactosidase